jgi:hypothetical protein
LSVSSFNAEHGATPYRDKKVVGVFVRFFVRRFTSNFAYRRIRKVLRLGFPQYKENREITIKISGCMNACGQQHVFNWFSRNVYQLW